MFTQYQSEPFICKTFIDGCSNEEIKVSYHQEQMKKPSGEWYLEDLVRSHLQIYQRTISAYININFKKSIKVDATSAICTNNISDEKWIVYCRYCDKKGHMMQSCNTLKQDKEKNQVNNEWINKPKAERKCD